MRPIQPLPLSSAMRLAITLSALFALSALVAGFIAYSLMSDELRARLAEDGRVEATVLAEDLKQSGSEAFSEKIKNLTTIVNRNATLYYFQPDAGQLPIGNMVLSKMFEGPRQLTIGKDLSLSDSVPQPEEETYYAHGIKTSEGWIIVAKSSQWISDSSEVLVQSIAWSLGVALLATIFLAISIGRRNASRLEDLNTSMTMVAAGDLTARVARPSAETDDIGIVARNINAMLERLQANVERLSQVSADIAHDLRSPLTRIRVKLEPQALRSDLPDDVSDAIRSSLMDLTSLSASFDAILQLSQMETGNLVMVKKPTDLNAMMQQVHEMLFPVAEEMGHELRLELPSAIVVAEVSEELLVQALVNLIENSFRHVPNGAIINLSLRNANDMVFLSVRDNGPGIPANELDKVTERFYRLDRSRNSKGTGIGLSLVRAIAALHGGELKLQNSQPGLRAIISVARTLSG